MLALTETCYSLNVVAAKLDRPGVYGLSVSGPVFMPVIFEHLLKFAELSLQHPCYRPSTWFYLWSNSGVNQINYEKGQL